MSLPHLERPDLPEFMTWEELEKLPADLAARIELWDGRVVWVRRGPMWTVPDPNPWAQLQY